MSEQAFLDAWENVGCPNNIYGTKNCYEFLNNLIIKTDGLVIVDHFSLTDYDNVSSIEYHEPYVKIIWRDFVKERPPRGFEGMVQDIFGADYLYSLSNIQQLKFIKSNNHLMVLVMPTVIKLKDAKKFLGINKLKEDQFRIQDNDQELHTEIKFIQNNYVHECLLYNLPFFSFLLKPKQGDVHRSRSQKLLLLSTLMHAKERILTVQSKLDKLYENEHDEIRSSGNILRTILESLLKYYCLFYEYSLPKKHYEKNFLGDLKRHLKKFNDPLNDVLEQRIINLANDFSHDNGNIPLLEDVYELNQHVNYLVEYFNKKSVLKNNLLS
ncbi:hypothetical protein [Salinibacillus kushneri]|nr:hypothetical protein [Salinibacillus kushneri]